MATQKFTSFDDWFFFLFNFTGKILSVPNTVTPHFSNRSCRLSSIHIFSPCFLIKNNNSNLDAWLSCVNPYLPLSLVITPWIGNINGRVPLLSDASGRCLLSKIRCIPFSLPLPFLYLPPGMWVRDWGSSRYFEPQEQELLKGIVE